ncbi:unnamed protein product [Microthlaspi erraticum]|uniref:Uncharacterized protein n=1 Tax=Microthlaspi erraticum TaxID=1685480 RepID=A0A6D2KBS1_9BRAS|nr:unnamed protein product [Microthlaspi erraticum]
MGRTAGWDGMGCDRGDGGAWSTVSEYRLGRRSVAGKISGQFSGDPIFFFLGGNRPWLDCFRACAALARFCPSLTVLSLRETE